MWNFATGQLCGTNKTGRCMYNALFEKAEIWNESSLHISPGG